MDTVPHRLILALFLGWPSSALATELGVDMNQPSAGGVVNMAAIDALGTARAPYVRINFVLDVWSSPGDATRRGPSGLTWFEAYDRLIDGYRSRGVEIYGLLGSQSTSAQGPNDSDGWQTGFVADAVTIIDHFKDRVQIFEIYNEPNNWVAPNTPALDASGFAHLLARTYQAVKIDRGGDPCWQAVTLVSGPILSLDGNTGADYLSQVYAAGRASWGWETIKQTSGSYPLEGAGYHIYVAQGSNETTDSVAAAVNANLSAFTGALDMEEGAGVTKSVYVSEIGWRTGAVSPDQQAQFMGAAIDALEAFGRVPIAVWFSLEDFGANDQWGLYTSAPYDQAHAKLSAAEFATLAAIHRASLRAYGVLQVPASMVVGSTADVVVDVYNGGTADWSTALPNAVRLGAGGGCPTAAAVNQVAWSGFLSGGYANSELDARAYLPADLPAGGLAEIRFQVTAPQVPGTVRFAARMVEEGIAWFGDTLAANIQVVPVPMDGGSPADTGVAADAGSGGVDANAGGVDASAGGADAGAGGADATSGGADGGSGAADGGVRADAGGGGRDGGGGSVDGAVPGEDAETARDGGGPSTMLDGAQGSADASARADGHAVDGADAGSVAAQSHGCSCSGAEKAKPTAGGWAVVFVLAAWARVLRRRIVRR